MKQWLFAQCRLCGLAHVRDNRVCQDAVEVQENESCIAAAVADGIGSLPNSEVAAQSATKTAVRWLLEHSERIAAAEDPAELIRTAMLKAVADRIREAASLRRIEVGTMDCNLAFVCIIRSHNMAIYGHLGDCAVCVLDNNPRVLTEQGGFANGTSSVLYKQAAEAIRVRVLNDLTGSLNGFILASDGVDGEIYRKNSTLVRRDAQDYFNTVFEANPNAALKERLLALQHSEEELFTDDISMVVLSQAKTRIRLPEDPMWLCRCSHYNPLTTSYCEECNADFLELYPRAVTKRFGSLDEAVLFFNRNPREARAMLGMPEDPEGTPENLTPVPAAAAKTEKPKAERQSDDDKDDPGSMADKGPEAADTVRNKESGERLKQLIDQERDYVEAIQNPNPAEAQGQKRRNVRTDRKKTAIRQRTFAGLMILVTFIMIVMSVHLFNGLMENWEGQSGILSSIRNPTSSGYLGHKVAGKPDGVGVMEKDGYFWVGVFRDGKMTGEFLKISTVDPTDRTTVIFTADGEDPEAAIRIEGTYVAEATIDFLLYELTPDSRQRVVNLVPGDIVYRTDAEETEFQGRIYVQIVTENDEIGWCDKACIEPAGA